MAYLLSNNCTKYYWNRTTAVKIIAEGWVVYFFLHHSVGISGSHVEGQLRSVGQCCPAVVTVMNLVPAHIDCHPEK